MDCKKCVCNKCINNCRCQFCSGSIKECDHKNIFEQISMFPKKKLARFITWDDYGISKDRYKELCTLCRSDEYATLARSAAHTANKDIEKYILLSVRENKSYEGVEYAEKLGRIPCGRTDFYGYRRLFFHNFDNALKMVQNQ